ncbi:MAG: chemotaxis protein CheD [Novosphingobium sp.]|nr:chemotaxis protein CheD [Novosphingobium sp.]
MLHQTIPPADAAAPQIIKRVTVMQGQALVSNDPETEFGTVLGSCVATCLFDAQARVGGMNHFLLPEPPSGHARHEVDVHYGVYLMEILINQMLAKGAAKARIRAHVYGGANLNPGMMQFGTANARFARSFLESEGIPVLREDMGGTQARRVEFRPVLGKVRCRSVEDRFIPVAQPAPRVAANRGDVELF